MCSSDLERLAGADAGLTALALAAAIQKINEDGGIDLVVTGMASLDSMTSMFPAALATRLRMHFSLAPKG